MKHFFKNFSDFLRDPRALIHPKCQNFIPWLQRMGQETDHRILKLLNKATYKPRDKKYEDIDRKIKTALDNYEALF